MHHKLPPASGPELEHLEGAGESVWAPPPCQELWPSKCPEDRLGLIREHSMAAKGGARSHDSPSLANRYRSPAAKNASASIFRHPSTKNASMRWRTASRTVRRTGTESLMYSCPWRPPPASNGCQYSSNDVNS